MNSGLGGAPLLPCMTPVGNAPPLVIDKPHMDEPQPTTPAVSPLSPVTLNSPVQVVLFVIIAGAVFHPSCVLGVNTRRVPIPVSTSWRVATGVRLISKLHVLYSYGP